MAGWDSGRNQTWPSSGRSSKPGQGPLISWVASSSPNPIPREGDPSTPPGNQPISVLLFSLLNSHPAKWCQKPEATAFLQNSLADFYSCKLDSKTALVHEMNRCIRSGIYSQSEMGRKHGVHINLFFFFFFTLYEWEWLSVSIHVSPIVGDPHADDCFR